MAKTNQTAKTAAVTANKTSTFTIAGKTFTFTQEDKIGLICLGIILLLEYIIRSKFLSIPFERDEGIYAYNGKLILDGKIPYVDIFEQKLPGIFYFFATIVWLFGYTVEKLHTGFIYLNLVTIIFIYFAVKNLFSAIPAAIAAATFAIASMIPNISGFAIQSEHGVIFFASMGILFYTITLKKQKWYMYLLMGFAMGSAFMTKTSGMFFVLWGGFIFILDFIAKKNDRKFMDLVKQIAYYSAGVFLIIGFFFLLITMKGAWTQMIYWAYEIPKQYVGKMPFSEGAKYFVYTRDVILMNYKFLCYHALLALFVCLLKPVSMRVKLFTISLAFFSSITIVPGYYFYGHYWIQLLPALAVLAGVTCYSIIVSLQHYFKLKPMMLNFIYLGIFVVAIGTHLSKMKSYYFHPNYERILRTTYGNNPFPEDMQVANYLNQHLKTEDQIVLLGSEPQIYLYTNKVCPSKYAYFSALVANVPQHHEWQREFIADVEKTKPRFLIFYNHAISLLVQPDTDKHIFEWANKFINENYILVGLCDMVDGMQSNYIWNEQLVSYKPTGQNNIQIYELKNK